MRSEVIGAIVLLFVVIIIVAVSVWPSTKKTSKYKPGPIQWPAAVSEPNLSFGTTPVDMSNDELSHGSTPVSLEEIGLKNFNTANTQNFDLLPSETNSPGQIEMRDFETVNGDDFERWQNARVEMNDAGGMLSGGMIDGGQ